MRRSFDIKCRKFLPTRPPCKNDVSETFRNRSVSESTNMCRNVADGYRSPYKITVSERGGFVMQRNLEYSLYRIVALLAKN